MIIAYNQFNQEVGRYDTASDLYYDYPDAIIRGNRADVIES